MNFIPVYITIPFWPFIYDLFLWEDAYIGRCLFISTIIKIFYGELFTQIVVQICRAIMNYSDTFIHQYYLYLFTQVKGYVYKTYPFRRNQKDIFPPKMSLYKVILEEMLKQVHHENV